MHSLALPPWLDPAEKGEAMRRWRKQKEFEQRFQKRHQALNVGVVRGKEAAEDWLPNFGSVWESGSRAKTRIGFQQAKVGPGSMLGDLEKLVKSGGKDVSEKEKERIIRESKKKVMEKIQLRMRTEK